LSREDAVIWRICWRLRPSLWALPFRWFVLSLRSCRLRNGLAVRPTPNVAHLMPKHEHRQVCYFGSADRAFVRLEIVHHHPTRQAYRRCSLDVAGLPQARRLSRAVGAGPPEPQCGWILPSPAASPAQGRLVFSSPVAPVPLWPRQVAYTWGCAWLTAWVLLGLQRVGTPALSEQLPLKGHSSEVCAGACDGNAREAKVLSSHLSTLEVRMARAGLLWLLGIPIPILLLMWAVGWLH
jgi:hypothetical protein